MENTLHDLSVKVEPEHQIEKMLKIICEKVETGKSSFGCIKKRWSGCQRPSRQGWQEDRGFGMMISWKISRLGVSYGRLSCAFCMREDVHENSTAAIIFSHRRCRRVIVGTQFTSPLVHRALGRMPCCISRVLSAAVGKAVGIKELSCKGRGWPCKPIIMKLSVPSLCSRITAYSLYSLSMRTRRIEREKIIVSTRAVSNHTRDDCDGPPRLGKEISVEWRQSGSTTVSVSGSHRGFG